MTNASFAAFGLTMSSTTGGETAISSKVNLNMSVQCCSGEPDMKQDTNAKFGKRGDQESKKLNGYGPQLLQLIPMFHSLIM
jgi:hypothetical protein